MNFNRVLDNLSRFIRSIRQYGINGTIINLKSFIQDIFFDIRYNLNTGNSGVANFVEQRIQTHVRDVWDGVVYAIALS